MSLVSQMWESVGQSVLLFAYITGVSFCKNPLVSNPHVGPAVCPCMFSWALGPQLLAEPPWPL